jgi:hypothetical protein
LHRPGSQLVDRQRLIRIESGPLGHAANHSRAAARHFIRFQKAVAVLVHSLKHAAHIEPAGAPAAAAAISTVTAVVAIWVAAARLPPGWQCH